jgi:CHAT domain-containing protein
VYDPNSVLNGLVLVDGSTLDPFQIKGSQLSQAPFVFLNACQVGSANKMLGDYAGLAEAFLYAGASGVVAPLWSVKDRLAREIALRFYEGSFAGLAPAEILRRERATFREEDENASATPLSYLFYGHPNMRLQRQAS